MVVTVSLVEAGCVRTNNPPGPAVTSESSPEPPPKDPKPEPEPEPKPEPEPEPPGGAEGNTPEPERQIYVEPDGRCMEIVPHDCPADLTVSCNPPPPQEVPCPDHLLPQANEGANVHVRDDGSCWEDRSGDMKCPKGAVCNPPPPRRVQCPKKGE